MNDLNGKNEDENKERKNKGIVGDHIDYWVEQDT
jgi:uncharacterized membrane-anchored protein